MSIYLKKNVSSDAVRAFQGVLQNNSEFGESEYVSPEEGLAEFKQYSGFDVALELMDENPLPPVYIIKPVVRDAAGLDRLANTLRGYPEVDFVQLDMDWIQKLHQMTVLAQRFVYWLCGLLLLGVMLVISNTIRLVIENRREEIVVVKLVGGTDAYVRRPLMYTGLWYGLIGAAIACLLIQLGVLLISEPAEQLILLYGTDFSVRGMSFGAAVILLVIGAMLGLVGSWLAVARHLRAIQPR